MGTGIYTHLSMLWFETVQASLATAGMVDLMLLLNLAKERLNLENEVLY
jgi:hypothetical protein